MPNASRFILLLYCFALSCADDDAATCEPGHAGCACLEQQRCEDALACVNASCQSPTAVGLRVSDPNARSCDVVLNEGAAHVTRVIFADSVQGSFVREAPLVAASFISASDQPIAGDGVQLQLLGADASAVQVSSGQCADRNGKPLAGVLVELAL